MRSGSEPVEPSRNDWLTGSVLDCAAGYRAMGQGRIPRAEIVQHSPWHLGISSFIRRHVPEFTSDARELVEKFALLNLEDGPGRTADSFRREYEARSQLAMDLTLASDVYLARRPKANAPSSFDDDMLSISLSTQAMTLGDLEPPPLQFSFLRPALSDTSTPSQVSSGDKAVDVPCSKALVPRGVRLLLQEWDTGSNPQDYAYSDPYDDDSAASVPAPRRAGKNLVQKTTQGAGPPPPAPSQRPPTLMSALARAPPVIATSGAASQPPAPRNALVASRSQDVIETRNQTTTESWGASPSSQVPFASTQVLPGPHGGRVPPIKKKVAKRRLGGF